MFLLALFLIIVLSYTPFGVYQMFLIIHNILFLKDEDPTSFAQLDKKNKVIVITTTNGKAADVVEKIISTIDGYGLGIRQYVIKEERDGFNYGCEQIIVPKDYVTKNGSRNKMRALQYGIEQLHAEGIGKETYLCHLDDDSVVTKGYLEFITDHMVDEGGQGCLRLREFGHHLLSSLSDIVRISNCEAWCRHYNHNGRPMFVHGEGLVVRADVEHEIGWDYATYGADDLLMGLEIAKRYRFGAIPSGHVEIAPPTSIKDYYKQRRRWFWSIFKNEGKVRKLNIRTYLTYLYMYIVGMTGLIGFFLLPYSILFEPSLTPLLTPFWIVNTLCFFSYYQFGAYYHGSVKYSIILFFLQFPIAIYDGLTPLYALLFRPDFTTFETIKKV
jgi:cellulose synthase/poly-beta-1,6-N-acetylglucosamine synthase-like glycosyltransferase